MKIRDNPNAKHRAVLWIHAEVHELNQNGECAGVSKETLKQTVHLDGPDKNYTIKRLNELLSEIKRLCQ